MDESIILMFLLCFCAVTIVAILYIAFDVNYFLKFLFIIAWGRLFDKKRKLLDTTTFYGVCITQDIDILLKHMNSARYLRELDFARYYYYDRSGLYAAIARKGASLLQTASTIRYCKEIFTFRPYKITTKLVYWENKHFYMEQRFISLRNDFVYAVALSRLTITGLETSIQNIIAEIEPEMCRPKPTKELKLWLEIIKGLSQNQIKQT